MRGVFITTGVIALVLMGGQASAETRYGCMAQDKNLNLAIHVEFSEVLGGQLSHLSGVVALKSSDVPEDMKSVRLTSEMVVQNWSDKSRVLLRFYNDKLDSGPLFLKVATEAGADKLAAMRGTYRLDQVQKKGPGFHVEGALFCQLNSMTTAALSETPLPVE